MQKYWFSRMLFRWKLFVTVWYVEESRCEREVCSKNERIILFCLKTFPCFFQGETKLCVCDTFLSSREIPLQRLRIKNHTLSSEIGLPWEQFCHIFFLMGVVVVVGAFLQSSSNVFISLKLYRSAAVSGISRSSNIHSLSSHSQKHSELSRVHWLYCVSRSFSLFQPWRQGCSSGSPELQVPCNRSCTRAYHCNDVLSKTSLRSDMWSLSAQLSSCSWDICFSSFCHLCFRPESRGRWRWRDLRYPREWKPPPLRRSILTLSSFQSVVRMER